MSNTRSMTRWKAAGIHLSISATIALIAVTLMLMLWFAPPFFAASGGQKVLLIMLGVDVTLGPLITLLVYNIAKSRRALLFDFSVIAILQIAALIYGMNVMFHARPVFVVFIKNSFDLVVANELKMDDINQAKISDFRSLPVTGPVYIYSQMPTDINERNEVVFAAFSGKDLPLLPKYYQAYAPHLNEVAAAARPIADLKKFNPTRTAEIDAALRSGGWNEDDTGFVPLRSKFESMAMLVNKHDGKTLTLLKLWPWESEVQQSQAK